MIHEPLISDPFNSGPQEADLARWRDRGARLARSLGAVVTTRRRRQKSPERRRRLRDLFRTIATNPQQENAAWLFDNIRLICASEKESRELSQDLHRTPAVVDGSGNETPRVCLLADKYLDAAGNRFSEDEFVAFLEGFQEKMLLEMGEVWSLKPALQLAIIDRLLAGPPSERPPLVTSLRRIAEATWNDLFESINAVDRVLSRDPVGAYTQMDFDSREMYRKVVGHLSKYSSRSEVEVAEAAIEMASKEHTVSDGSRAAVRRSHVGFYLVDRGLPQLESRAGYRAPVSARLSRFVLRYPTGFYLIGIELLTLLIVFWTLSVLDAFTPIFAGLLLLLLPATQAAVDFMNNLATSLVPPRALPKMEFKDGVPDDCVTLVAVPSLLLNSSQVHDLVLDLEIRYLANADPNIYFALVTDSPDSDRAFDHRDELVNLCAGLIENLNRRYRSGGRSPLFLLHRHRAYNESEGRWMGWERKRGKLLDLNQLLRGGHDAFPVKVGDISALPGVRYVITLDSDTQLPRDSARKLVGTIAHPLNQAVVDPVTRIVVEGYGILQPRIGISIQSASRSRLASLYSGQTGFDIYTRAISDVYQDLFGEGIFTGKGIYDVDALRETLEHRFPENALLSHDLIEGAHARAALVSDIELIDDYPSHFSAYSRRKHRWVRGDWQILRWVRSRVPDYHGRVIVNPMSLVSHWKILDNLRRSLIEPAFLLLFVAGWLYLPGPPWYWTAATLAMLLMPVYGRLLFTVMRMPLQRRQWLPWLRSTASNTLQDHAAALLSLTFLLHQALLSIDAIARTVRRVFFTRRRLLEWETAAEAEAAKGPKATVDVYLEWTPYLAALMAIAVWFTRPSVFPYAAPVLVLWLSSRAVSHWLNRPPRTRNCELNKAQKQLLTDSAERICRFFRDWSSQATNWLIPDSVHEDGAAELRLSPTNLGMLLNARIAAVHLGHMSLTEFVYETRQTLDRIAALPKHRGHLLNWYDIRTLAPLEPRFVSTVDSGNLAAALWTVKQAALAFAAEPAVERGVTPEAVEELRSIAETCHVLVRDMDFRFLYQPKKKVLSVGYDTATGKLEPSCYDLLASEARIASFVAIAKGDIPQESWFHLGRTHTIFRGERVLVSWTGTIFEYLMPGLWMRHYSGTITEQSRRAAVRVQREFARRKGVPWGISESACLGEVESAYSYAPFGIPALALKRSSARALVISPYSSFLAACVDPAAAVRNLALMAEYGWSGRYGFYEAVDYSRGGGGHVIRSWMAHHQGMSLLAIVNLLFDNPMQKYFHAEPQVMATELLLHERVPTAALVESEPVGLPEPAAVAAG